jgi:basic amino acid/polyamine antiporter, APA family
MIGAGLFAAFTPAAAAAGSGLLVGLLLAAVVAWCNATSSAQLAARYPVAGGTYHYGRELLGPWWGFAAGWGFVVGKTASAAAMALTFAAYALPSGWWQRVAAALALVVLALVNCRGITRTALLTRIIVAVVLVGLAVILTAVVVTAILPADSGATWARLGPAEAHGGWYGVLQSGGLLFFAFAGYARIATLGEEVRDPARTIPRAIVLALLGAVMLYTVVGCVELAALGADGVASTPTPLVEALSIGSLQQAAPVLVRVIAAIASLGALLALIAGIGRTTLAMARTGDLPPVLAAVHPTYRVPHRAELAIALVAVVAVLAADLRAVIGFSSFGVLLYYAVANLSALRQRGRDRRYPRAFQMAGLVGCLTLAAALPFRSVLAGLGVFAVGFVYRAIRIHWQRRHS